jgi:hypothetical protein
MMFLRAAAVWGLLLVFAITNGAVREALLAPWLGAQAGHVLSTLILCAAILLIALLSIRWIAPRGRRGAVLVGVTWLALTLVFEFLAGHYLFGDSWEKLLADYNLLRGRLWILVLMATLFAPAWALGWNRAVR